MLMDSQTLKVTVLILVLFLQGLCVLHRCVTEATPAMGIELQQGELDGFSCYEDVGELTMYIPICELQCL